MEPHVGRYAAFFDVDKTILSVDSGSFILRLAYRRGLIRVHDLLNAYYVSLLFKFHLRPTSILIEQMGKRMRGLDALKVSGLVDQVVKEHLMDTIRPEIRSEILFHRQNNAEIVILSSAMAQVCYPIASCIDANNVICSELEVADGKFTGYSEGKFCIEEEKMRRLVQYCEAGNYRVEDVFYYTDSIADLATLEIVGHPVCVKPDRRLLRIAQRKGWRII